jgi:glycosyltransferase involved in cell wall biosynthesis
VSLLRVAFVDQVGDAPGGAEQTLATFLEHAPRDIDPSLVLFDDGAFADRLRALGLPVDVVPVPEAVRSSTRERMKLGAALRLPATALHVAGVLRKRRIQLVYTNSMKAHLVGSLAARLLGVPWVPHFHDNVEGLALHTLRSFVRSCSCERVACSHAVARTVGVAGTTVIYAPLVLSSFSALPDRRSAREQLGLPPDLPLVSLVGRINRWKGHDRFLRIAARVRDAVPAHFLIGGAPLFRDADFVPELHALVDELALRDHVSFLPWVEDVRTIYAATDVNCNCSRREPFGRSAVEAAAARVPTVCFDDSGAAETIVQGVTGRVVAAGDETAFAEAIVSYLSDRAALEVAGIAARVAVSRFDAPQIAEEMAHVMRRAAT